MSLAPRQSALEILMDIEKGRTTLDQRMDRFRAASRFDRRDEAFVSALVYGVLRWRGRLDGIIGRIATTSPQKMDRRVLTILRMGLFQILYMDRVPHSAAVNTSVDLAKGLKKKWLSGFVNAVLRNALRALPEIAQPLASKDVLRNLCTNHSMPEWLVRRWLDQLGPGGASDLCEAVNQIPPLTLRTNTLKIDRPTVMHTLKDQAEKVDVTRYAPDGLFLEGLRTPLFASPAFSEGWFQVQDEAAQAVGHLLAPRAGERVLDACAGLGGKTAHLAALMKNAGRIQAVDRDGRKLQQLSAEMQRLGIGIVSSQAIDLQADVIQTQAWGLFDRILLDAPCSGLGVLRRNPDTKWVRSQEDIPRCAGIQSGLLDNLAPFLKVGGILVYAVCSTEPEETHAVVGSFLNKHPAFAIDGPPSDFPSSLTPLMDGDGCLTTGPHRHGTDGFFAIRLRRRQ